MLRLEEIGAAASKEYSLEKAMEKMRTEWEETEFTFIEYRDTVSSLCEKSALLTWSHTQISLRPSERKGRGGGVWYNVFVDPQKLGCLNLIG